MFDMLTMHHIGAAGLLMIALVTGCEGHPPPQDTDRELFRTAEQLTGARELILAKRVADFYRESARLPDAIGELGLTPSGADSTESLANDGWGRPITYNRVGLGFELISAGRDGMPGTGDDIRYLVEHPDSVK